MLGLQIDARNLLDIGFLALGALGALVIRYGIVAQLDKGKAWFIQQNTNTGKCRVFRAAPGSEGLRVKIGNEALFVKLKSSRMLGHSDQGPVFSYDADTGQIQQPLKGSEGLWEGLDGKTWASFLKSGVNQLIGQSAGGGLMQTLLVAAVVMGGITILILGFVALKLSGALH